MYFESEVFPLLLTGFFLVMLLYGIVLFSICRRSDSDIRFPAIGQLISLLAAFILFLTLAYPQLLGITGDDRIFGAMDSVHIAACGFCWALSMFFNGCLLWNLHKKKK